MRKVEIFCPKCIYRPKPADLWQCQPGCGCLWNTFDTCGVCPQCGKNWEDTACPACWAWSPHIDWYHESIPKEQTKEEHAVTA